MFRLPRFLVAALVCLAPGVAALQQGSGAPRPEDGPSTVVLFVARPASGEAPLSVEFLDRSFGGVTSWAWQFGDGQTSTRPNPTHVYTEGGVYSVRLTVTGPHGTATLEKPAAVTVRSCTLESARDNRAGPLERGEDFVPITGDDGMGIYCVYSGKAVGPGSTRIENNVGMFILPLVNDEVLLFGSGYGDPNSFVDATADASHDVRRVDAIIRFCLGRTPKDTPIRFVAPHGHIDHINADCIRELRERGYPIVDITFHSRDATWSKSMPGWTADDRAIFRTLKSTTDQCQEELLSFASPLGKIWFYLRDGHTPGSLDLVIDVRNDPNNRFVVRGSGEIYGACPLPGVREAIEPHGNVLFGAPEPKIFGLGPAHGSALGGTEVALSGSGFAASLAGPPLVLFDGSPASSVKVLADDTLTCVVPPGLPGEVVPVRLLNRNGQATLEGVFSYRELPTLGDMTPARGLATGGTRVTLSGSGFQAKAPGTNLVTFAGRPATSVQVIDDSTLQCTIPPHAPGFVPVMLANLNGTAELATRFLYDPTIDVVGVTPATGSALGGTRVQITGSAFATYGPVPEVQFGAVHATAVVRLSDTRLECTTPAGPSGTSVDVRVSAGNGADSLPGGFRYFLAPKILALDPPSGPESGGTLVTLTGSNFTKNNAGPNSVTFGGRAATGIVAVSDTVLRCLVPAGAGGARVDVQVSNANGTGRLEQGYRYHRPPVLATLAPELGPRAGGTLVTLHGSGFLESGAGASTVLFGGSASPEVNVVDDVTLTCRTPAAGGDGTVDVELVNPNGRAVLPRSYRYLTRPALLAVEPAVGPARGGTAVTLRGTGFLAPGAGPNAVRFGGAPAADVRVLDDATLTCRIPLGTPASSVDVVLSNQNGSARLAEAYQYLALPKVSGLSPLEGPVAGGTRVRVSGLGFLGAGLPTVRFGTGQAVDVVVASDRSLECTTPPGPTGPVDVSVRTPGGTAVLGDGFVYGATRPTLASLAPDHGPSAGGTVVELRGTNFLASLAGQNTVRFGGVAATAVVAVNDGVLRCVAPAGTPGALVDVRVANSNGNVTLASGYRYHLQPVLASITPAQGSPLGGTLVTLRGSGFVRDEPRDLVIRFGAASPSEIQVLDDSTLTCRAPAGSAQAVVDVELASSNGRTLLAAGFRYGSAPSLQGVAPASGSPLGGTLVTLTGTHFTDSADAAGTTVLFGASAANAVTIVSDTTLTCLTPAGAAGTTVDLRLGNENGAATLAQAYRYHAAPVVLTHLPSNGPAVGGTTIVLTGSGFRTDVVGPNTVTLGGRAARSVTTVDDTRVRVVTAAGTPGAVVELVLANSNGSLSIADGFRYNALPAIAALEPPGASALGGTLVTLRGSGFQRDAAGVNSVLFGALPAGAVSVLDDQTLTCLAPAASPGTEVVVSLANANGGATAPAQFRYFPAPRLDALLPQFGFSGGGELIELHGSGWLGNGAGPNAVRIGGVAATEVTVDDDAVLRCRTPAGAPGPVSVAVENANGSTALTDGFYYDWAPTLKGCLPDHGTALGGTEVTLTGGGFATAGAGPLAVRFGANAATNVRVQDGGRLLCRAPAGPGGTTVSVVLTNSHGSSSLSGFRYHAPPALASVDPALGPPAGGTLVTLRGTGFGSNGAGLPVVRFGGTSASAISVVDDTTVRCMAPPGPARTSPEITLTNANGTARLAGAFRWLRRDPGDLDDDGVGDALLAGSDGVYVFFGAVFGLGDASTAAADLVLRPVLAGTDFGAQLASGDLNGDQLADLVVAAPLDDAGGTDSGAVYVFFGPLAASATPRTEASASAVFRGAAAGDRFGTSVLVSDVTGDGLGDLAIGSPFDDAPGQDGGAVYVYRGRAGFAGQTTAQAAVRLLAAGSQHVFGGALAAGDVTGDGFADVVVGAPLQGASGGSSGAVHVFRGGPGLVSASAPSAVVQIAGAASGERLGTSVGAADFDGDGIADLFLGAPLAKKNGVQGGAVYYLRGGASLATGSALDATAVLEGENAGDRLGQVLGLGDVDGDGLTDLLLGAPQYDLPASNAGRAYLVRGGPLQSGSIALRADTILVAENSVGDQFGTAVGLTDLDGDDLPDLLVGAPFNNGGALDSGRVHVFWAAALLATRSGSADDVTYTGAAAALSLGREVGSSR